MDIEHEEYSNILEKSRKVAVILLFRLRKRYYERLYRDIALLSRDVHWLLGSMSEEAAEQIAEPGWFCDWNDDDEMRWGGPKRY
jgi:hypothetical protein